MTLPSLRWIVVSAPLAIATGLAGVWIAKPSSTAILTVPRGATVQVRLAQPLASDQSVPGERFKAILAQPVSMGGKIAIPAGTEIEGKVVDAFPSSKGAGPSRLRLTLSSIKLKRVTCELYTTDVARYGSGYVSPHWDFAGGAETVPSAAPMAGKGMLVAAPMGATATVPVTPDSVGKNVSMPAETLLRFRLIEPLVLPHQP